MGGCPIDRTYDFTIPADAPSKEKALFAWTWFNRQGNREMYMNCAVVDIVGSKAKTNPKAFVMPEIFKANIFGVATCITKEGVDIVFPNPGKSIKYGGPYAGNPPKGFTVVDGCPRTNNQDGAGNREQNINSPNPILEQKPSSAEKETTTSVVEKQMFTSRPMVTMTPIIIKTLTTVAEPEKTTTMTVEEMTNITRTRNSTQTSVPVPILTILTSKVKLSTVKPTTLMTATRKYAAITQTVTVTHTTRVGRPIPSATTPPNNVDKATSTKPTSTKPTSIQLPTPEPTKTPENVQCTPGKVICLDLHHLAMCVDNSIKNAISLGPAPEGTVCVDGGLIHAGNLQNGRCNKEDARKIKCTDGGKGWEKCDGSWWIHMGRVAEGTGCVDGEIQAI